MQSLRHDASTITPTSYAERAYVSVFKNLPEHIVIPLIYITGVLFDTFSTLYVTSHEAIGEMNPLTATVLSATGWPGVIAMKIIATLIFLIIVRVVLTDHRLTWYYITTAFFGLFWFVYGVWNIVLYVSIQ